MSVDKVQSGLLTQAELSKLSPKQRVEYQMANDEKRLELAMKLRGGDATSVTQNLNAAITALEQPNAVVLNAMGAKFSSDTTAAKSAQNEPQQDRTITIGDVVYTRKEGEQGFYYVNSDGQKISPEMTYVVFCLDKANGDYESALAEIDKFLEDPMVAQLPHYQEAINNAKSILQQMKDDNIKVEKSALPQTTTVNDSNITKESLKQIDKDLRETFLSKQNEGTTTFNGETFRTVKNDDGTILGYYDKDGKAVDENKKIMLGFLEANGGDKAKALEVMDKSIENLKQVPEGETAEAKTQRESALESVQNARGLLDKTEVTGFETSDISLAMQEMTKDNPKGREFVEEIEQRRENMVHTYTARPDEKVDEEALKKQGYTTINTLKQKDYEALQQIDKEHPFVLDGQTLKLINEDGSVNQDNLKLWALYQSGMDTKLNTKSGLRKGRLGNSEVRQAADAYDLSKTQTKRLVEAAGFLTENHGGKALATGLSTAGATAAGLAVGNVVIDASALAVVPGAIATAGATVPIPIALVAAPVVAAAVGTPLAIIAAKGELNVIHQNLEDCIANPDMIKEGARGNKDKEVINACVDLINEMKKVYPDALIVEAIKLAKAERSDGNVNSHELAAALDILAKTYPNGFKVEEQAEDTCCYELQKPVIQKPVEPPHGDDEDDCVPSYDMEKEKPTTSNVPTIRYGGPYHYAQLYENNGQPLTRAQINELTRILQKEMREVEGDRRHRVIPNQITLSDGTVVTLLPEDKIPVKVREIERTTHGGGRDVRYARQPNADGTYSVIKIDCDRKKSTLKTGLTEQQAKDEVNRLRNES